MRKGKGIKIVGALLSLLMVFGMSQTFVTSAAETQTSKDVSKTILSSVKLDRANAVLTWKENKTAEGYQIYSATEEKGKYEKVATVKKGNTSYTIKDLKEGFHYYKIRAYKTVEKKTYYGAYSAVKFVKYVKKGKIYVPKATDVSLAAPADISIGVYQDITYEDYKQKTVDCTSPYIFWTKPSESVDGYYIQAYDENDNILYAGCEFVRNEGDVCSAEIKFADDFTKKYTFKTIVITSINSIDGMLSDIKSGQDKIGNTTIYKCDITVNVKKGKQTTLTAKAIAWNEVDKDITISDKVKPYSYYILNHSYTDEYGTACVSQIGNYANKDGIITFVKSNEDYIKQYKKATDITLMVYTDLVVENSAKASVVLTIYDVKVK